MGPLKTSVSQDPFGLVLPLDVLGAAVDGFNDVVMVTEVDPIAEPGPRVLFVNPAFERITGYKAAEVLGRSPRFLQGPGTSAEEIKRIEEALAERRPVRAELLNYKKDGTPFWFEFEASSMRSPSTGVDYFVFIQRDITERKRSEVAQREQERAISTLFSNLPGMAYRCLNDGFWTMEFVSRGCRELTGFDPEALIGNHLTSYEAIIEADDRKAVREIITRAVERGDAFELTYRIRTRDGGVEVGLGSARPRRPGPRRTRGDRSRGSSADITERKLLESQVLQGQRIESIGTLAGGIAHDLNNVLAPIMMAGDLLADRAPDKETAQLLNVVSTSARRGAELLRQILLFARGIEGPRVTVDSAATLRGAQDVPGARRPSPSASIFERLAPGASRSRATPCSCTRCCSTSVNARDAMPNGGRLAISADGHLGVGLVSPPPPRRGARLLHPHRHFRHGLRHPGHFQGPGVRPVLHHEGRRPAAASALRVAPDLPGEAVRPSAGTRRRSSRCPRGDEGDGSRSAPFTTRTGGRARPLPAQPTPLRREKRVEHLALEECPGCRSPCRRCRCG